MRALSQLVEHRRRLVADRVRITNRLTSALKTYFPQVLQWLPNKETQLLCDFLSQWPTLKAAQLARRSTLERFFRHHHVHGEQRINERLEVIKSATALTSDEGSVTKKLLSYDMLAHPRNNGGSYASWTMSYALLSRRLLSTAKR